MINVQIYDAFEILTRNLSSSLTEYRNTLLLIHRCSCPRFQREPSDDGQ